MFSRNEYPHPIYKNIDYMQLKAKKSTASLNVCLALTGFCVFQFRSSRIQKSTSCFCQEAYVAAVSSDYLYYLGVICASDYYQFDDLRDGAIQFFPTCLKVN